MDENFILEMAQEGEKKLAIEIPGGMGFGDALNGVKGTFNDVVQASDGWKDKDGLKTLVALEAQAWRDIFGKALEVAGSDESSLVSSIGDAESMAKLEGLIASGNKVMEHVYLQAKKSGDAVKVYFAFRTKPGVHFTSSLDFG